MPGLVPGDGGDRDESDRGPALEDPGSDGRTDTLMGRGESLQETLLLALLGQGRASRGGDIGTGSWRGRRCQAKEMSTWEGVSAQAKYYCV